MDKKPALSILSENKSVRIVIRVVSITIISLVVIFSVLALFLRHCENNHRYFMAGTRIHAVKPRIYDAHYQPGTLVFVGRAAVRELEKGTLISMAVNADFPLTFNNERFVEFQEEYYGRSLHGIATENTVARDRIPLRGGRYIGVPQFGIPLLGAILVWIIDNATIFGGFAFLLVALSVLAIILTRGKKEKEDDVKITFKKAKR